MAKIKLIVDGGAMKPGPAVAQQIGPMGINLGKVIEDVNKATADFKGMRVPVEIDVDTKTKSYGISVSSPPVAELIKKELGLEKGSGEAGKTYSGDVAFETVLKIAQMKLSSLPARTIKAAVSEVVGSCVAMGVLIDNKSAKEVAQEVSSDLYDKSISSGKTEVSPEKKKQIEAFWKDLAAKQERSKKALDEAKAAEEAAKAAAATATGVTQTTTGEKTATPTVTAGVKTLGKEEKKDAKKEKKK